MTGGESVPSWMLYTLNGIAAILVVIGWRHEKLWMVYVGQGIAQFSLIMALALIFKLTSSFN